MGNNEKIIENGMMEWRDENNGIKYDGRMLKSQKLG